MKYIKKEDITAQDNLGLGYHILCSNGIELGREVFICTLLDCKASEYLISNAPVSQIQKTCLMNNMHTGQPKMCYWTGDTQISGETPTIEELAEFNNQGKLTFSGDTYVSTPFVELNSGDTVISAVKKFQDEGVCFVFENII